MQYMKMYSRPKVNKMKAVEDAVHEMVEDVKDDVKKASKPRRTSYKRRMSGVKTGKYASEA